MKAQCSHPGVCLNPVVARGLCNAHYLRLKLHGTTGAADIKRTRPAPSPCAIPECNKRRSKRDWCGTHYERWRIHGDPAVTHVSRGNPGYLAMHKQVHRRKGKASQQSCVHCGGQARQWAYDHLDPDERVGLMTVRGEEKELRYSRNPAHYIPLCVSCHVRFDQGVAA
jgi:hypothetical protein